MARTRRDATTVETVSRQQSMKRWGFIAVAQVLASVAAGPCALHVPGALTAIDDLYPLFTARTQSRYDTFTGTLVVMA